MQPQGSRVPDILKTARTIGDTGLWLGQWAARAIVGPLAGICSVCNNLQPHGHEDTIGRTPNSLGRYVRSGSGEQPRADLVREPALFIPDIKTKDLLRCRDVDPKTGRPFRDCRYCRLLCDALDAFFIDEWMSWITDTRNGMHLSVGLMIRQGKPLVVNCSGCFTWDPLVMYPRVDLEMFYQQPDELAVPGAPAMGLTLPRVMDTREPGCMQFARDCIRQCQAEHPRCATSPVDFVPTRLLSLGRSDDDVRLCEAQPASTSWAALSHCWGGSKPLKLYSSNIADLRESIPVPDLPPTFRDAIQVCRSLSIDHLWIDSLCIIQDEDDRSDWEREAALMGKVYSHAFLVIVGASSAKPEVPFLAPREEDWGTKTVPFETPAGAHMSIKVRKRHLLAAPLDHGPYEPPFTATWATLKRVGPLYKRGWCFQESYMAPRALHFAPGALIFECRTHRRSDDSPPPHALVYPGSLGVVADELQWRTIVKAYTARQLTVASDKLPAVSGVASMMPQAASGDRYLAGLWGRSLLADLLWHVMPSTDRTTRVMTYEQQQAPSWSWASINHGVLWNVLETFEPLASVLEVDCTVLGTNPYGTVSGGHVKLAGHILPCRVNHRGIQHHAYYNKPDGTRSQERWFVGDGMLVPAVSSSPDAVNPVARRYLSGMETSGDSNNLDASAMFFCVAQTGRWHFGHVGLLLNYSETHPGCMERIGVITNLSSDWYDGGQHAVITVV